MKKYIFITAILAILIAPAFADGISYNNGKHLTKIQDRMLAVDHVTDIFVTKNGIRTHEPLKRLLYTSATEYSETCKKNFNVNLLNSLLNTKPLLVAVERFESDHKYPDIISKTVMDDFNCDPQKWGRKIMTHIDKGIKSAGRR